MTNADKFKHLFGIYATELWAMSENDFLEWLNADAQYMPTVERKTGKWIFGETMGHSWMKCSECCKSQDGQTLCFTYCPNCGAKMDK